jgi:thiamine-monophosphate kinase
MSKLPGEFELIERLCAGLHPGRRVILGPGDDCAILAPSRAPQLLTIDSMVEGVHFKLKWAAPRLLGERALTVNLSDVAAMVGSPTACVVNLAVRKGLSRELVEELYAGLKAAAKKTRVDIVGGNITRAAQLAITIAVLGEAPRNPLRRDAARPGDEIHTTGTLGDAAAGCHILEGKLKAAGAARKVLVGKFLSPIARLAAGQALSRLRPAPAAIDISDGLLQDLGHILERSGVSAEIDSSAIPVSRPYRSVLGDDLELALTGGEDYELLFCLRPGHLGADLARRLGVQVRRIGRIVRGRPAVSIAGLPPRLRKFRGRVGWDQLRSRD